MIYLSTTALIFLLVGIFTSKELIEIGQLLFFVSSLKIIYESFKQKQLALPKSAYWLIAFILIALLSLYINDDVIPRASINRAKLKYPLYGVLGIYFFRYWIQAASEKIKYWTLNTFFLSVIVASIYGIVIYFIDNQKRLDGLTYTSKFAYGSALFLILLFTALLHKKKFKNILNPYLGIITFITCFIGMILTQSRGPMFTLLCAMPIALYFYHKKVAVILGSISLLIVLSAGSYYFWGTENSNIRFLITKQNGSDSKRKSLWQSAVIAIKERPILGWGYSNFKTQVKRIKEENNLAERHFVDNHAHNNFLEIAAGTGLLGLFAFLGWFLSWGYEIFRSKWTRILLTPFTFVFFITSQVEVTIIDSHLAALIYLIYSLSSSYWKKSPSLSYQTSEPNKI